MQRQHQRTNSGFIQQGFHGLARMPLKSLAAALCGALGVGLATQAAAAASVTTPATVAQSAAHGAGKRAAARPLAASIPHAVGVLSMQAAAIVPAATDITNSSTHGLPSPSTITNSGTTWTIVSHTTVASSHGKVEFNSFGHFDVAGSDTVNLDMGTGVHNLVNLVWDAAAHINGTVNGHANGQTTTISGNVFFADPHGVVVGADGVLNVGALSLSAPSDDAMGALLDYAKGSGSKEGLDALLEGREPTNAGAGNTCADGATAMICVDGTVNANNAVRIHATTIDVHGNISVSGSGTDSLATAVNVEGIEAPVIVDDGNTIRLVAQDSATAADIGGDALSGGSVALSGTLATAAGAYADSAYAKDAGEPDASSSWGDVALTASAASSSNYSDPTEGAAIKASGDLMLDQDTFSSTDPGTIIADAGGTLQTDVNLALGDKLGQVAYVRAFATASVELESGASINAGGNVLLQSATTTSAGTDATTEQGDGSIPVAMGAMYGAVDSKASTLVDAGAAVNGNDVTVESDTDNTLSVAVNTIAGASNVVNATVAWSQAAVKADAQVNGSVTAHTLDIGAHNANDFSTTAGALAGSDSTGGIGIVAAVSRQIVVANATLGAAPTMSGDDAGNITVAAETDTEANETSAATRKAKPKEVAKKTGSANADLTATVGAVTQKADGKSGGLGSALPFKVGAAVAWTDSSNSATATIAPGLTMATPGNVAVQAVVSDEHIHNGAESEAVSKGKDESGAAVTVSAAVSYAHYTHSADAEIGSGDAITARNIGVDSQVIVPFDWTFDQDSLDADSLGKLGDMGKSLDDFEAGAGELYSLVKAAKIAPKIIMEGTTGMASASGEGSDVTVGGSVNYFGMDNSSRAWVGSGSSLTSKNSAGAWTSDLGWLTGAREGPGISVATTPADDTATPPTGDGSTFTWDKSISILASTDVAAFNLVGTLTPWSPADEGETAAIGGAFNYGGFANTTTAGADANVMLASKGVDGSSGADTYGANNAIAVNANSSDTLFVLSPISGKGGSAAIQGMVALTDLSDHTHATLSGSDTVNADALDVDAGNPLMVWSLTGALATSSSAGIGIGVGINDTTTDTRALIGDNSFDEIPGGAAPAETGGTISVASLGMNASSSGETGALSVAGSSVSDSKSGGEGGDEGSSAAPTASGSGSAPGAGLLTMLTKVGSVADKLRTGVKTLQDGIGQVDDLTGGSVSDDDSGAGGTATTLLGKASSALTAVSAGTKGLTAAIGKLSKFGKGSGSGAGGGEGGGESSGKSSFGIAISGAASVNIAALGTQTGLSGVTVDGHGANADDVTLQALNDALLTSVAGGAAIKRSGKGSSGGSATLAGAVAYSSVADTTKATIGGAGAGAGSTVNANRVVVQALDNSEQFDAGVGVVAQVGGSGSSLTVAGSVSIAQSNNQTDAALVASTLTGDGSAAVQLTGYDASRIGIGAASISLNTGSGSSANGSVSLTYADIDDATSASVLSGAAISHYDDFSLNALDGAEIIAAAATGSVSTSSKSNSLTGAVVVNKVSDDTTATISGGSSIDVGGNVDVQAAAVAPDSAEIAALDLPANFGNPASSYFDFTGTELEQGVDAADAAGDDASAKATRAAGGDDSGSGTGGTGGNTAGWGSSIIAVAGDLTVSGNNVGLSFAYSSVANKHQVSIDDATLASTAGAIDLESQDHTRIISVAAGLGVATGEFAGMGSVIYNAIGNTNAVALGSPTDTSDATSLTAQNVTVAAGDTSRIYGLAGAVAVSAGTAAAGGAVAYNNIGNTSKATADHVAFTTTAANATDGVTLQATNAAKIMAGAVAAGVTPGDAALGISFGWNQTGNDTQASLTGGSVIDDTPDPGGAYDGALNVRATDTSTIQALSGAAAVSGSGAAAAAVSVQEIGDSTQALLQDAAVQLDDVTVDAKTTATEQSIALGIGVGADGGGTGSVAYNCIGDSLSDGNCSDAGGTGGGAVAGTTARVSGITGKDTSAPANISDSLSVSATDGSGIQTLAVSLAGGGEAGIGAAVAVSDIGTTAAATIGTAAPASGADSTLTELDVGNTTDVNAKSNAQIESLAVGGAASGGVSVAGSSSTNLIDNSVAADMTNVSTGATSDPSIFDGHNATAITATNSTQISSLAGAVAYGSTAVGASVAVNHIGTQTTAAFHGSGGGSAAAAHWYQVDSLTVQATATDPGTAANLPGKLSSGDTNNANIQTIAVAGTDGGTIALSGSVAVNQITGATQALIDDNAGIVANDNVGVLAGNVQGINVFAGSASLGGTASAGAGVVINLLSGDTNAYIGSSEVTAYGQQQDVLAVDDGTPTNLSGINSDLDVTSSGGNIFKTFKNNATSVATTGTPVAPDLASDPMYVSGVAVHASNEQHAVTFSLGIAAGEGLAGTAEVGANVIGGTTDAHIDDSKINQVTPTPDRGQQASIDQQVSVGAYNAQYAANYLLAGAASTGEFSISAAAPVNTFNSKTQAWITDSTVSSRAASKGTQVTANSYQWSLNNLGSVAVSTGGAASLSGAVSLFGAATDAWVSGGSFTANSFDVLANSAIQDAQVGGALAVAISEQGVAGSGMALVNIDNAETSAKVQDGAHVTVRGDATVKATSSNVSEAIAAQLAAAALAGLAGTVDVNVLGNATIATIDGSTMTVDGALAVTANDNQTVEDIIGGAGVGAVGLAGGVNVTLLQTQVHAGIDDHSTVTNGGGVNVAATSTRNVDNATGSGAAGIVGIGASVGVVIAGTGDGIQSNDDTSMLDSSDSSGGNRQVNLTDIGQMSGSSTLAGGTNYGDLSQADVDSVNSESSYATSWNDALDGTAADGITAGVSGGSTVSSTGAVSLGAHVIDATQNNAGVGAGGLAAIGVSVAYTSLNSSVGASVDGTSSITQATNVNIQADVANGKDSGGNTLDAASTAVSTGSSTGNVTVGAMGVNVAVAKSEINNTVTAGNAGTITGITTGKGAPQGSLKVQAIDSSTASAGNSNPNITAGGVAVGTMVDQASRSSTITATLGAGSTTRNFATVRVAASDIGGANAEGVAGTGGILTGDGADISAEDTSIVTSSVGTPAVGAPAVTTTLGNNGDVTVTAQATPTVTAKAKTTTVGGVAVGVNLVKAEAQLTVQALIGTPASQAATAGSRVAFDGASTLGVEADFTPTLTATAVGNTGGIVAVNAATATVSSSGSNNAEIGSDVTLPAGAAVGILANSTPVAEATASGILVGALVGGEFSSSASSDETTTAALDAAPTGQGPLVLGGLSISAAGNDTNDATTKSGSGSLVGGLASNASTSALSSTRASLGAGWNFAILGRFNLVADQTYTYGGTADSHAGAAFGGSGAYVSNVLGSVGGRTAVATIGAGTSVVSNGDVVVQAQTTFASDANNGGATSGAGGIINGTAAKVDTTLNASNLTHVGEGDTLAAEGMDSSGRMSAVQVLADTVVNGMADIANISIDGAVPVANAVTDMTGNVANRIDIDENSTIYSYGNVDVATYSELGDVAARATGSSNGVAGVATSSSTVRLTSNQAVNIGTDPGAGETVPASGNTDVSITSLGGTYVIAGHDVLNGHVTQLGPQAIAQAYVRGLIAVPHAEATATASSVSTLTMGHGASVTSDGNVALGSTPGLFAANADGEGHGYELGFIPVTQNDSSKSSSGTAQTTLNGTVSAGTPGDLDIHIDAGGNLTSNSQSYAVNGQARSNGSNAGVTSGVPFEAEQLTDFDPSQYETTNAGHVTAWVIGTTVSATPSTGALPQYGTPLYVQGGNVLLYGGNGTGSGTNAGFINGTGSVTANGAPSIVIDNDSDNFLVIPGIKVAFGLTGAVDVNDATTGGASFSLNGIAIAQTPTTRQPDIAVNNNYTGSATPPPDIILTNTVTNYGGAVTLTNQMGSIQTETVNSNAFTVFAPNGNIGFQATPGNMDWFAGGDPAGAADVANSWFLSALAADFQTNGTWDAGKVAAAIAQSHYAPGSVDQFTYELTLANYNNAAVGYASPSEGGQAQKTPIVVWGACEPETYGGTGDGCHGSIKLLPDGHESYMLAVPWVRLMWSSATPPPAVPGSTSSVHAKTLTINACNGSQCGYINVDAPITVGNAGAWTLQTEQGLKDFIAAGAGTLWNNVNGFYVPYAASTASGSVALTNGAGQTLYYWTGTGIPTIGQGMEPLLGTSLANSQLIGATYDTANHRIVLDNVYANGGGSATLKGHVVSTGSGSITVNNGYGQVLVSNSTGLPLQVNGIDTGTAQTGVVTIEDYSKGAGASPTTTWYVSVGGTSPLVFTDNKAAYAGSGAFTIGNSGNKVNLTSAESKVMGNATQAYLLIPTGSLQYDPAAGQYYNWGVTTQVFRNVTPPTSDPWSFGTPGHGQPPVDVWSLVPANGGVKGQYGSTAWVNVPAGNAYAVRMHAISEHHTTQGVVYHGCGGDVGDGCHYGTTQTGSYGGKSVSYWNFIYPNAGELEVDVTQNASLPIGVNFNTTGANRVEVDSNADIDLNGIIDNTVKPQQAGVPDTLLHTTSGGNIIQQSDDALIWTHDLAMIAQGGGSVGTAFKPIQVRIANAGSDPTATLVASTDGNVLSTQPWALFLQAFSWFAGGDGGIHINVDSGTASLPVQAIAQGQVNGDAVYGDVDIQGTGALVSTHGAAVSVPGLAMLQCVSGGSTACGSDPYATSAAGNLANAAEDVVGYSVQLASSTGGIGTDALPLNVQTQRAPGAAGALNVNAHLDINLVDDGGDVLVGSVASATGDVSLTATRGGIYDAKALSSASTLTKGQQTTIWQQAGLLDGSAARQAVTGSVNSAYAEYQQMLGMGTVDPGTGAFAFTLTGAALQAKLAAYWPLAATSEHLDVAAMPSDVATLQQDVETYLSARGGSDVSLFNQWIGNDWNAQAPFTSPGAAGYVFVLSGAQQTTLASDAWSVNQLLYSLNAAALQAPASTGGSTPATSLTPTLVGTQFTPNISGQNVTLTALNGAFGQLGQPVTVNEADFVNLYKTGVLGGSLTPEALDAMAAANTPGDVVVHDSNGQVIAPETLATLDLGACLQQAPGCSSGTTGSTRIGSISIKQTDPLFVAAARTLSGTAGRAVYIQAMGDLHVGSLSAGGDMSLAATGNIQAPAGATYPATTPILSVGGNLVIASNGSIDFGDGSAGTVGDPLPVNIGGELTKGSANGDLLLSQGGSAGDLRVNEAVANGLVLLHSVGGSLYAVGSHVTVAGNDITLQAADNIGYPDGSLQPLLVQQTGSNGVLDANAVGGALNIAAPTGDLNAGTVQSGKDLTLAGLQGNLTAGSLVSGTGAIYATANRNLTLDAGHAANGVQLVATIGTLTATGAVASDTGNIDLTGSTGILVQGPVHAGQGDISGTLTNTGGDATFEMGAGAALDATSGKVSITAPAAGDSLLMDAAPDGSNSSQVAAGGSINITVGGNAALGLLRSTAASGEAIVVDAGGSITGNGAPVNLQARGGGSARLQSVGDIGSASLPLTVDVDALDVASTQGSIYVHGLGDLAIPSLHAHGNLDLSVDQVLAFDQMNVGGDALVSAGAINGNNLAVGGHARVNGTADVQLGDVTTGQELLVDAGGTLAATTVTTGTDATFTSGSDMTLGSVHAGNDLAATSGGNLAGTTLASTGTTTLTATQAMTLGGATSGGDFTATAGTDLTAGTIDGGGTVKLTATAGALKVTDKLTSAGDTSLQSGTDTAIQALDVGGNLAATAGGNLAVAQGTVTGTGNLDAGQALTLGSWTEGADLTTQSGTTTTLGTVLLTGGNLKSTADGDLDATDINVRQGSMTLGSGANLAATTLAAADDIMLRATGKVTTHSMTAGHDMGVTAGGDISMDQSIAGHDIAVDTSGGAVTVTDYARAGDGISLAGQAITADDVEAPNTIRLWARDGNLTVTKLTTKDAYLQANGDILLDAAFIGDRINLQAHDITAHLTQTSAGQPLYSVLSGYQGGIADRITVDADIPQRWIIDRLAAVIAALRTTAPNVDIPAGRIMQTMALDTSIARVRMNQQSPILVPADVQLMQRTYDFELYQDGIHTLTDSFIVRFGFGFQMETPNYIASHKWMGPAYLGESALRNNGRFLDMDDYLESDNEPRRKHVVPDWIHADKGDLVRPANGGAAVNLHASR